jgi:hypothetical protein
MVGRDRLPYRNGAVLPSPGRLCRPVFVPVVSDFGVFDIYQRNFVEMDSALTDDKKESIVRKIRRFPFEDRRYIIYAAVLDLDRDMGKPNGPDRYAILLRIAEQATGHQLTDERTRENTDIRTLVATEMRSEGFTLEEIGIYMRRNHSTVTHYTKMLEDAMKYPKMYADLIQKHESFKQQLKDYDKRNL